MVCVRYKKIARSTGFVWFLVGGIGHFVASEFSLTIATPNLPLRLAAVYISGSFELTRAIALLNLRYRRAAGIGLFMLTIAVTPANVYMLFNLQLFPGVPEILLWIPSAVQVILLGIIWWSTRLTKQVLLIERVWLARRHPT